MLRFSLFHFTFLCSMFRSFIVCSYEYDNYPFCNAYDEENFSPVNILTYTAKWVSVSPLVMNVSEKAQITLHNLASIVRGNPTSGPTIILTGSTAGRQTYALHFIEHFCDGIEDCTRVGAAENGRGTPLQHIAYFYNTKYGSPEKALNYRNGYIGLIVPVVVVRRSRRNRAFEPYLKALSRIREPNTNTTVSTIKVCSWLFEAFSKCGFYYFFPGTAFDDTGKQYSAATVIVIPSNAYPVISYDQFCEYLHVLNQNKQPLTLTLPAYPQGRRPLYKAYGPTRIYNSGD